MHGITSHNPQPRGTPLLGIYLAPRDPRHRLKKKKSLTLKGSLNSKDLSVLPSGTPACFMSKNYGPRSDKDLLKMATSSSKQPRMKMATMGEQSS